MRHLASSLRSLWRRNTTVQASFHESIFVAAPSNSLLGFPDLSLMGAPRPFGRTKEQDMSFFVLKRHTYVASSASAAMYGVLIVDFHKSNVSFQDTECYIHT